MDRRAFLACAAALPCRAAARFDVKAFDRDRVLRDAGRYLGEKPVTVTASHSPRSAGGLHDFFSEGDYWWPDPKNPESPYIRRDGESNPANFDEHRKALMRLSVQMPALAAAWYLTGDKRYSHRAADHLRAWFVDESTRMSPNLQYAQAIHGITSGRGVGVIDTIHLVEVAQAAPFVRASGSLSHADSAAIDKWFADYTDWLTTSRNGVAERDAENNHGTCWGMQVAAFAKLTGNRHQMNYVRNRFRSNFVPRQMALDGSFPRELARTKPYSYSLFNLEAMAAICEIVSGEDGELWHWSMSDGRGIAKAIAFLFPYVCDKSRWPKRPDVQYFSDWPMRQSSLLFGGLALDRSDYISEWKKLPADSNVEEVVRNFFIRQPVLWVGADAKRMEKNARA